MSRVSPDDLSPGALKFSWTREIDLGFARVRAARMSYVGGPGWELYVPTEMARHAWLALQAAGEGLRLRDAGYYALDALRIEAGRRAWGAELGPDETPRLAGAMAFVQFDKVSGFIGREALLEERDANAAPSKRLVSLAFDDASDWAWGGEAIVSGGSPAGEITSAGWSLALGRVVALAYVRGALAARTHAGTAVQVDLWGRLASVRLWDEAGAMLAAGRVRAR